MGALAGLQDRFPDDFYDRKNLFATYLGGGKLPTDRVEVRTIKCAGSVRRNRARPAPLWRQRNLARFVLANLSDDQIDIWLKRVTSYHRMAGSNGSRRERYDRL
jgi:uncharacterized protein YjiS (DUF1127 family)